MQSDSKLDRLNLRETTQSRKKRHCKLRFITLYNLSFCRPKMAGKKRGLKNKERGDETGTLSKFSGSDTETETGTAF